MRRIYVGNASDFFGGGGVVKGVCGGAGRDYRAFKSVGATVSMRASIKECMFRAQYARKLVALDDCSFNKMIYAN